MTQRRLIVSFAAALAVAGCAHISSPQVADQDDPADSAVDTTDLEGAGLELLATDASPAGNPPDAAEATPPPDLWERIRAGLQMQEREDPRVESELAFYVSRPEYIERVVDRAEPYLHYIVEELDKRGMPMELALLPVVESAFQPFAYSPGRAAGIWQFIPSTGRHYGLKQTWWYDGRRDVIASTKAALDYLQRLHGYFNDWELALAAYNAGEGTVMRAIRYNERRGKPTDFWNLRLPRETRNYVPRLLAVRAMIKEPERYDLALRSIPDEPYLTVVDVGSQIDLALAASLADMSIEELYRLNPGFNRWATDPDGPHLLVLPIERAERFEAALAGLPPSNRVSWERHRIARGETLSQIADRYHTTVEVLRQANELRGNMIRAGQYLIVPVAAKPSQEYVLSADQRLAKVQQTSGEGHKQVHTVQRGDTLWEIARRYGVSLSALAKWNGMAPRDPIQPGQTLVVWTEEPAAASALITAARTEIVKPPAAIQKIRYKVRRGDSLYRIAQKFNVSVDDLVRWNGISKQSYLRPGQQLTLHVDVTRGSI